MIRNLLNVSEKTPLPEMQARLSEVLGLERPVPMAVLLRAIEDPGFANDLITCRGAPGFLAALFDDRRTLAYAPAADDKPASSLALASKAATALIRWGKAGFSTVDERTLGAREAACLACPHLGEPQAMLQKLVPTSPVSERIGSRLGRKVCTLCGCVASRKIRLPSETCPGAHPIHPGLTRWGEERTSDAVREGAQVTDAA
jgi:hypothetical protein